MNDSPLIPLAILLGSAALFLCVVFCTASRLAFPGERAEIESVRRDIASARAGSDEDVVGQAVELNRRIASAKEYNARWWADIFIPDGWDAIEPIAIPEAGK